MRDWLLERGCDGESYTYGKEVTEELLLEALDSLDGRSIFYCGLAQDRSDNVLRAFGAPGALIVEAQLELLQWKPHLVVLQQEDSGSEIVELRHDTGASDVLRVPRCEVLTLAQARELFLGFFRNGVIPNHYRFLDKAYCARRVIVATRIGAWWPARSGHRGHRDRHRGHPDRRMVATGIGIVAS